MRKLLLACAAIVSFVAIAHARQPIQPFQPPTATELFQLRATCAKLGDQMMAARVETQNKLELSGQPVAIPRRDERSRYNPTDGHCYVDVTLECDSVCRSRPIPKFNFSFDRQLIDGQTGEVLATASIMKDGIKVGTIYDRRAHSYDEAKSYDEANSYMDKLMQIDPRTAPQR